MNDPKKTTTKSPYTLGSTARRMAAAAGGGLVLFAFGALVVQTGAWQRFQTMAGFTPDTPAPALTREAAEAKARQEMLAARAERKKDKEGKVAAPLQPTGPDGYFVPPLESEMPDGPEGDAIRRGRDIFIHTPQYAQRYVGNSMACAQCHLDAGRRENSAPMWAAYVQYPKYRAKNNKVNTLEERINGCFNYSMNAQASEAGKAPPPGDDIYKDLMIYMYWLADGAPTGEQMRGGGYIKVKETPQGYDHARGAKVYAQNCALCHGDDGQGRKDESGKLRFPPLWGPEAYNWGAGMARIDTAAGFIKANMPLGKPHSLSDQDAWDAAAYINSHERPKDPRQTGTIEEARVRFHKDEKSYYGKEVGGKIIGAGVARTSPVAAPKG
ncbi:c-type cytochrome [Massilia arenae]|uniref:C-type cytochrome n=1 Tax=Massilia arenae TaxID=2603288 RepID=A0A5C7G4V0_9BURK|nr:c-type cytochrome [Massilia arenae]TXF98916.1 c-type cytochrome [Massilia arenae]